jgi:hypothetical protein
MRHANVRYHVSKLQNLSLSSADKPYQVGIYDQDVCPPLSTSIFTIMIRHRNYDIFQLKLDWIAIVSFTVEIIFLFGI